MVHKEMVNWFFKILNESVWWRGRMGIFLGFPKLNSKLQVETLWQLLFLHPLGIRFWRAWHLPAQRLLEAYSYSFRYRASHVRSGKFLWESGVSNPGLVTTEEGNLLHQPQSLHLYSEELRESQPSHSPSTAGSRLTDAFSFLCWSIQHFVSRPCHTILCLFFAPCKLLAHTFINAHVHPFIYWSFNSTFVEHILSSWPWWYKMYWHDLCSQDFKIQIWNTTAWLSNLISYRSLSLLDFFNIFAMLSPSSGFLYILHPFHFSESKFTCLKMLPHP